MRARLFVGNLRCTTEAQLLELFCQHAEVVAIHVAHGPRSSGNSAFAFVDVGSSEQAEMAVAHLNGLEFFGDHIRVEQSRPQPVGLSASVLSAA